MAIAVVVGSTKAGFVRDAFRVHDQYGQLGASFIFS